MLSFELREVEDGLALSGGQLEKPLLYREKEPHAAVRLIGFLSQQQGSELRVYDRGGELKSKQHRKPAIPFERGSLGDGLRGASHL